MSPYEAVLQEFTLPHPLYEFQVATVNTLAPTQRAGYWLDPGTGKTLTSTVSCLYKHRQVVVIAPPVLGVMWMRFLRSIPEVSSLHYAGSPKARAEMSLDVDFIVMSIQIFKKDYDSLLDRLDGKLTLNIDECVSVKGITSDSHKAVLDIMSRRDCHLNLLSGTPLSTVLDAYAYNKLLATGAYRSYRHFLNLHVESYDFFGNPEKFKNLPLLYENMRINSVRILKEDILKDLPPVTFSLLDYALDPQHYRLYKRLAEEELLELESGGKFDATSVSKLYHALGQIVINWGHFAEDEYKVAKAVELAEEILAELGDGKLAIFTNYRMTNAHLSDKLKAYNPAVIYGAISGKEQQRSIDRFIGDPACRVFLANFVAGGVGLDGLQHVCSTCLVLEMPAVPSHLQQAVARLHRNGQTKPVTVHMAAAEGTLQVKQMRRLVEKDELVNRAIRNARDLRDELFGDQHGKSKAVTLNPSCGQGRRGLERVCTM